MKLKSRPNPIVTMTNDLVALLPEATGAFAELVKARPKQRSEILKEVNRIEK